MRLGRCVGGPQAQRRKVETEAAERRGIYEQAAEPEGQRLSRKFFPARLGRGGGKFQKDFE